MSAAGATLMVFSERARPVLFYFNSECNFDTPPPLPQLLTAAHRSHARKKALAAAVSGRANVILSPLSLLSCPGIIPEPLLGILGPIAGEQTAARAAPSLCDSHSKEKSYK